MVDTDEPVARGDILWLGIAAGCGGGMVGGILLGIGMSLIVNGQHIGLLLMLPGAPAAALPGWLMARRLARRLATAGARAG
jgi:hypothetical protein